MVECTFCKKQIPKATGTIYVKKDGKVFNFCTMKCEKNMLKLKRKPRYTEWSGHYEKKKKVVKK